MTLVLAVRILVSRQQEQVIGRAGVNAQDFYRFDEPHTMGFLKVAVVDALEETLTENLGQNGFSIKLGKFGKFSIRHRPGTHRRIPLTGETSMTSTKRKVKFVAIGRLRQLERVHSVH
jgi:nucleoid DNA-binding protein